MRYVIDARYIRKRPSGIGNYVDAIVQRLPALAPDAQFRLWTHPERPEPTSAPNVVHHVVREIADGLTTLLAPSRLDALEPDDVIHFPYSLLGRGLPCATVVSVMDVMWVEQPALVDARPWIRRARQLFYQAGMVRALRSATRILTISKATADRIIGLVPEALDRITVTHCAVSPEFSAPEDLDASRARAAELLGTEAPYYLVVGKNEPYKAHDVALRAFAAGAHRSEKLVLVQRENAGRGLRELAHDLGIARRVIWAPNLSFRDLIEVLRGAHALLQPSLVEGFGMPALEAIACGCPVVASDAAALVEVLGGAGLHAVRGDHVDFARALRRLRDGAFRTELRARGLERARAFNWDHTARATLDVYRAAQAEWGR